MAYAWLNNPSLHIIGGRFLYPIALFNFITLLILKSRMPIAAEYSTKIWRYGPSYCGMALFFRRSLAARLSATSLWAATRPHPISEPEPEVVQLPAPCAPAP